jgi:hypothetical protein
LLPELPMLILTHAQRPPQSGFVHTALCEVEIFRVNFHFLLPDPEDTRFPLEQCASRIGRRKE